VIESYIEVVKYSVGKTVWDPLQHRIFLGDEAFVARHQAMQYGLEGELFKILFKRTVLHHCHFLNGQDGAYGCT
jgi:putative transposase